MFTGIVKGIGTIERMETQVGNLRLSIRSGAMPWDEYEIGESISVNGVCLTAVALHEDGFECDVSPETAAVTTLGGLVPGSRVNLEPALAANARLGGHFVSGHVDCVGTVVDRSEAGGSVILRIGLPAQYRRYAAPKGSICVDGVSLTINEVSAGSFTVNIIPHTAEETIAGGYRRGDSVNLEVDLIARYLERLLEARDDQNDEGAASGGITGEFLRKHGYA